MKKLLLPWYIASIINVNIYAAPNKITLSRNDDSDIVAYRISRVIHNFKQDLLYAGYDFNMKSIGGWIRVLNSDAKLRSYGLYIEKHKINEYLESLIYLRDSQLDSTL